MDKKNESQQDRFIKIAYTSMDLFQSNCFFNSTQH